MTMESFKGQNFVKAEDYSPWGYVETNMQNVWYFETH